MSRFESTKKYKIAYEVMKRHWNSLFGEKLEENFVMRWCDCRGEIDTKDITKMKYQRVHSACGYPIEDKDE